MSALQFCVGAHSGVEIGHIIRRNVNAVFGLIVPDAYLKVDAVSWIAFAHGLPAYASR